MNVSIEQLLHASFDLPAAHDLIRKLQAENDFLRARLKLAHLKLQKERQRHSEPLPTHVPALLRRQAE